MEKQKENADADVTLIVGDKEIVFPVQMLVQKSNYFQALLCPQHEGFADTCQNQVQLKGASPEAMQAVLSHLRTEETSNLLEKVKKSTDFALQVLIFTSKYQLEQIFEQCARSIDCTTDNCLVFMNSVRQLGAVELYHLAHFKALWNFSKVCQTSSFLELTLEEVTDFLAHDKLIIKDENEVVNAVLSWVTYSSDRQNYLVKLLRTCVRWNSVSDLGAILSKVQNNVEAEKLISSIIRASSTTSSSSKYDGAIISEDIDNLLSTPLRSPLVVVFTGHQDASPETEGLLTLYFFEPKSKKISTLLTLDELGQGLTGQSIVPIGKDIYIVGGERNLGHGNWQFDVLRYDTICKTWETIGRLPSGKRHTSVCVLDEDLYIIGGCGKFRVVSDECLKFSTVSGLMEMCPKLPETLYSACCCVHDNLIYVFGNKVYRYRPMNHSWDTLHQSNMPRSAAFNCAMPHENRIYLTVRHSNELMVLDVNEPDNFVTLGQFQHTVVKSCLLQDKIFTFAQSPHLTIEVYDIKTEQFCVTWQRSNEDSIDNFHPEDGGATSFPLLQCWPQV